MILRTGLSRIATFIFFYLFSLLKVNGQHKSPVYTYALGGNFFSGYIIDHNSQMSSLSQTLPYGIEFSVKKSTYGFKPWEELMNYPDINFSLSYMDYQNPVLGSSIAAQASMDYYLMRKRKHEFYVNLGTGLVYTTDPHDQVSNPDNIAISLPVSFALQARAGYNFAVNSHLKLTPAVTLIHYSNGAHKMPNMGINVPVVNLGASYSFNSEKVSYLKNDFEHLNKGNFYHVLNVGGGVRETSSGSSKYPFLNLSFTSGKMLSYTNALIVGIDAFFCSALKNEMQTISAFNDNSKVRFRRIGATLGHELVMGRLSLIKQFGYYLFTPEVFNTSYYQRYGLRYTIKEHYVTGISLKSHLGKAEAVEWSIGVRF